MRLHKWQPKDGFATDVKGACHGYLRDHHHEHHGSRRDRNLYRAYRDERLRDPCDLDRDELLLYGHRHVYRVRHDRHDHHDHHDRVHLLPSLWLLPQYSVQRETQFPKPMRPQPLS